MTTPLRRMTVAAGPLLVVVATVAACGGSSAGGTEPSGTATQGTQPGATTKGGARAGGAAASGKIAEIDGNTLQVQSTDTQTAVQVSTATKYTQRVPTTLAAVQPGTCVVATSPSSSSAASSSTDPVTATTVLVSAAVDGSCSPRGGPTGQFPSGGVANRPSGAPSGLPSGAVRRSGQFGAGVSGMVLSVSGSTITVSATALVRTPGASPSASPSMTTRTITVTSSTTYTHTVTATKSALKVGLCADAFGSTGSTGTVKATRIALSSPTSGRCQLTFGVVTPGGR